MCQKFRWVVSDPYTVISDSLGNQLPSYLLCSHAWNTYAHWCGVGIMCVCFLSLYPRGSLHGSGLCQCGSLKGVWNSFMPAQQSTKPRQRLQVLSEAISRTWLAIFPSCSVVQRHLSSDQFWGKCKKTLHGKKELKNSQISSAHHRAY